MPMMTASVANLGPDWRFDETWVFGALRNSDRTAPMIELAFALRETTPVSDPHALALPFRHPPTCFDLTPEELAAANDLLLRLRANLLNGSFGGRFQHRRERGPRVRPDDFPFHIPLISRRKEKSRSHWAELVASSRKIRAISAASTLEARLAAGQR